MTVILSPRKHSDSNGNCQGRVRKGNWNGHPSDPRQRVVPAVGGGERNQRPLTPSLQSEVDGSGLGPMGATINSTISPGEGHSPCDRHDFLRLRPNPQGATFKCPRIHQETRSRTRVSGTYAVTPGTDGPEACDTTWSISQSPVKRAKIKTEITEPQGRCRDHEEDAETVGPEPAQTS